MNYKTFRLKKGPEIEVQIKPIIEQNYEETARLNAYVTSKEEPLSHYLGMDAEYLFKNEGLSIKEKILKEQLSVAVYDTKTNECIFTLWVGDPNIPYVEIYDSKFTLCKNWETYLADISQKVLPNKSDGSPLKWLCLYSGTVHPAYSNIGLATEIIEFIVHEHPNTQTFEGFWTQNTNAKGVTMLLKVGFKILWEASCNELSKLEGLAEMKGLGEHIRKHFNSDYGDKSYLMAYVRTNIGLNPQKIIKPKL